VSSYVFGTNDSVNYGSPNVENEPSVQDYIRKAHLTLLRTVFQPSMSDAEIQTRVQAVQTLNMQAMCLWDTIDDIAWMKHVETLAGSRCQIWEFGNERDGNGYTAVTYTAAWNADIPQLRAINPTAKYGGPASIGVGFVEDFMKQIQTTGSGLWPDFVSWHEYPCYGSASKAACLTDTQTKYSWQIDSAVGWEQQYIGHRVPTGMTEYNFDPGGGNMYAWAGDGTFTYNWTKVALTTFINKGYDFATQYTSLNYSGYGNLDMFADSAPFSPKGQFWAMVEVGEHNGSGSTLPIPNPCC
jgi:hypothetical protein